MVARYPAEILEASLPEPPFARSGGDIESLGRCYKEIVGRWGRQPDLIKFINQLLSVVVQQEFRSDQRLFRKNHICDSIDELFVGGASLEES